MDDYLRLALAEGFNERPVAALLWPDLDPAASLADPPEPPEVPRAVAERLRAPDLAAAARDLRRRAQALGYHVLTPAAADYPDRLRRAPLRPLVLFVRGDPTILRREPAVAVVGSRTPTPYGRETAEQLCRALARAGVVLWSGLARGIDAIAHDSCVEVDGPTVAVLAGGLDRIYPAEHEALASTIVAAGGCLVAELPPGRRPRRGHFVRRNRILAAGTAAVVVVEATLTSGALHTARFAADGSSDIFAVPGPIHSELSHGCHRLITEGAQLVEGPEALLRDLGVGGQGTGRQALELHGSADEQSILSALSRGARPTDLLQRESGLERGPFLRTLMALEERGALRRMAGDLWALRDKPAGPPGGLRSR